KFRRHFEDFEPAAMQRLSTHPWAGNVRELRNVIERTLLLENERIVTARMLLLDGHDSNVTAPAPAVEDLSLRNLQLQALVKALERARGNQSEAARLLGVSRDIVRGMMRQHAIELRASVVVGRPDARPRPGEAANAS